MSIKKTRRKGSSGFSLLELLLVLSLAPIVFFVVYSNFSTGVALWQRLQKATPEEDAVIFAMKARRDFENSMRFLTLPFEGDKESVAFTAGIDAGTGPGGKRGIGRVRYFYDPSARGIMRSVSDYSQVHEERTGPAQRMLAGVRSFEVSYLAFDALASKYAWSDEFVPGQGQSPLPAAVRLKFSLDGGPADPFERTFLIPAGGGAS